MAVIRTPNKKRDGALYYYTYCVMMIILLPLWIPVFIIDVIFNITGLGREIVKTIFRRS